MAQLREIKRRIKSIQNTAKVTHAMELVAAVKMRKSQEKALSSRPYTVALHQIIKNLRQQSHKKVHQLQTSGRGDSHMIILLTSDRGLVGGLNLNVFKEIAQANLTNLKFVVVGKKGTSLLSRAGSEITASFLSDEQPFLDLARTLTKLAVGSFLTGVVSSVFVIFPDYVSTIKQIPTIKKILPIDFTDEDDQTPENNHGEILFEPTADIILEKILPHHVLTDIYQTLLEAKASEHSARMVAMKNATDAASDLVFDLTLTFNQARQEAITKEVLDIVTAQSAFN